MLIRISFLFFFLAAELQAISDQLSEGGKSSAEVEKVRRKLGMENEELQVALEEAELALESEEAKFLKMQLEMTQMKQTLERKMSEKDEELENVRKNHQRQLEALQSTIDNEQKSKSELQKGRKKHDSDIADLEAQLEAALRTSGDYQKAVKKLQSQIKVSDISSERFNTEWLILKKDPNVHICTCSNKQLQKFLAWFILLYITFNAS